MIEEIGKWQNEKTLGTGAFGCVVLWRNKETNDAIAIKECRWGIDPTKTTKERNRWKLEVDMMSRLSHPNVVTAIPVPPELDVSPTELPLLAMEFCSNGDLRKLLSKPENCCGLKEKDVRLIMKHISSAINYLHSVRITHRDLKPENIVIQTQNEKIIYKLIDLGYAKELDQGSLCTSFVGTLQYLAPELFMSREYSRTVDYWSLGLITHEIITGTRPFLPDKYPAEWIPIIKQKNSSQIRAYLDEHKNIVFSSEICPFHFISDTFKPDVEEWLQIMLEFDPKKRGRKENTTFLSLLETILNKQTALVFCIETLKLHSFTISEELTLVEFAKLLEMKTKIPESQQEILLPNGQMPDPNKGAKQFVANLEEEEYVIFLLNSKDVSSTPSHSPMTSIPPNVESMLKNPDTKKEYMQQRSIFSEAVHFCQQECINVKRIHQLFKASLMHLLNTASGNNESITRLTASMNKLVEKCSDFKSCLRRDIRHCERRNVKVTSHILEEWKTILVNLKNVDDLEKEVSKLKTCSANIIAQSFQLHKSSFAKSKITAPIEEVYGKILEYYSDLKKRPKEQRLVPHCSTDFVEVLNLFLNSSHELIQELLSHIRKVKQIKQNISDCQHGIRDLPYEIAKWEALVRNWQSQRQREIWELIDNLNKRIHQLEVTRSPSPVRDFSQISTSKSIRQTVPDQINLLHSSQYPMQDPFKQPCASNRFSPPLQIYHSKTDSLDTSSSFLKEDSYKPSINSSSSTNGSTFSSILFQSFRENLCAINENQKVIERYQALMTVLENSKDSDISDARK